MPDGSAGPWCKTVEVRKSIVTYLAKGRAYSIGWQRALCFCLVVQTVCLLALHHVPDYLGMVKPAKDRHLVKQGVGVGGVARYHLYRALLLVRLVCA